MQRMTYAEASSGPAMLCMPMCHHSLSDFQGPGVWHGVEAAHQLRRSALARSTRAASLVLGACASEAGASAALAAPCASSGSASCCSTGGTGVRLCPGRPVSSCMH